MYKVKFDKSLTIRVDVLLFEEVEELRWEERKGISEMIRELIKLGLEVKNGGEKIK